MNGDFGQDPRRASASDRQPIAMTTTFQFGPFTFTTPALELSHGDVRIELSPDAARVLLHLLEHANQVVTEVELAAQAHARTPGRDQVQTEAQALDTALETVRRAISGAGACECRIETRCLRRDVGGYVFVGDVERVRRPCSPISGSAAPGIGGHGLVADAEASSYGDDEYKDNDIGKDNGKDNGESPIWQPPVITNHQLSRLNAKLTPDARRLVEALAVVGMATHPSIASQVTGLSAQRFEAALTQASGLGLVRVEPGRAIRFPRADLRRAIDETISLERRAVLEAAAGDAVLDFSPAFDPTVPPASAVAAQLDDLLDVIDRTRATIEVLARAIDGDAAGDVAGGVNRGDHGALDDRLFPRTSRVQLARIARELDGDLERAIALASECLEAASRLRPQVAESATESRVRAVVEKLRVAS